MAKDTPKLKITSPKGVAIYPKLNEPDTKFDKDGVYEVKLAVDANDPAVQAFRVKADKLRDDYLAGLVEELTSQKKAAKARELKTVEFIKPEVDEETGEETGRLLFKAKMKAGGIVKNQASRNFGKPWSKKPDIFDATGKQLKVPPRIGGGSELKVSVELEPYLRETDKTVGVSCRLQAVQVIKLVVGGQRSFGEYGFDAEDGDEIEDGTPQAASSPFSGEPAGDADDDV